MVVGAESVGGGLVDAATVPVSVAVNAPSALVRMMSDAVSRLASAVLLFRVAGEERAGKAQ